MLSLELIAIVFCFIFLYVIVWPAMIDRLARQTITMIDNDDFEHAENRLRWLVKVNRPYHLPIFVRAYLRFKTGDLDGAIVDLQRAIELDPENATYRMLLADIYVRLGKLLKSHRIYRQTLYYFPSYAPAQHHLIQILVHLGRLDDALAEAEDGVNNRPDSAEDMYLRGYANMYLDNVEVAEKDFKQAILNDKNEAKFYLTRSLIHHYKDNLPGARHDLTQATQIKPDSQHARAALIYLDTKDGTNEAAITKLTALIEESPDDTIAYEFRATIRASQGDFAGAEDDLQQALTIEPKSFSILIALGDLRFEQEEYDAAEAFYAQARALKEYDIHNWIRQAFVMYKTGDQDTALRQWQKVIKHDRRYANPKWITVLLDPSATMIATAIELIDLMQSQGEGDS